MIKAWLTERAGAPTDPLFPTRTGTRLSRDAVEHRLATHLRAAASNCPSINTKHITTHTLGTPPRCAYYLPATTSP